MVQHLRAVPEVKAGDACQPDQDRVGLAQVGLTSPRDIGDRIKAVGGRQADRLIRGGRDPHCSADSGGNTPVAASTSIRRHHKLCWTREGTDIPMTMDDEASSGDRLDACRGCVGRLLRTVGCMADSLLTFADLCRSFDASPDRMRALLRRPDFPKCIGLSVGGRSRRWFRDEVVAFIALMESELVASRQVVTVRRGPESEVKRIAGSRRARGPSAPGATDRRSWRTVTAEDVS